MCACERGGGRSAAAAACAHDARVGTLPVTLPGRHIVASPPPTRDTPPAGPSEIEVPSFVWRSGTLGSLVYYLAVYVAQALTPEQGKALLVVWFLAHGVLSCLTSAPCDFTAGLGAACLRLLNIPAPARPAANGGSGSAKPAGAARKKAQ